MIRLTDMEFISMLTDPSTKVLGRMTSNMALGLNIGLTIHSTLVNMLIPRRKVKVNIPGQMEISTLGSGKEMSFMAKVFTNGMMAEFIPANGRIISCMAKVLTNG